MAGQGVYCGGGCRSRINLRSVVIACDQRYNCLSDRVVLAIFARWRSQINYYRSASVDSADLVNIRFDGSSRYLAVHLGGFFLQN